MRRPLKIQVALGGIITLIVAWIATLHTGAAFAQDFSDVPAACLFQPIATPLSRCIDPSSRNVVIGQEAGSPCLRVSVDRSYTGAEALGTIQIGPWGQLFVRDQTVNIETKGIDGKGLFQVGTAQCPIGTFDPKNQVTITFTGPRPSPEDHTKGIVVQKGGRLSLFGARGVPGGTPDGVSWTHLSEAAGPPDKYGLEKYFYDSSTGMLYFNVVQDLPNPVGPSPLGSCSAPPNKLTDDPSCPDFVGGESYYACPAAGCPHYVVLLNDSTYQPGRSTCEPYETYAQNPPANENVLVLVNDTTNRAIETSESLGKDHKFPHHVSKDPSKDAPICPITTP